VGNFNSFRAVSNLHHFQIIITYGLTRAVRFAETNFFYCLLDNLGGWIPWRLVEIPPENRNKGCPIRYSLEIDMSQLHTKSSNGIEHGDFPEIGQKSREKGPSSPRLRRVDE
jgi:hypothetical protein